jgi:hypothetical protein
MRALRRAGVQQLHPDDGAFEKDDDVPGVFRGEVISLKKFDNFYHLAPAEPSAPVPGD